MDNDTPSTYKMELQISYSLCSEIQKTDYLRQVEN